MYFVKEDIIDQCALSFDKGTLNRHMQLLIMNRIHCIYI